MDARQKDIHSLGFLLGAKIRDGWLYVPVTSMDRAGEALVATSMAVMSRTRVCPNSL